MKRALQILAGPEALRKLKKDGIRPEDIGTIAGAAGGPKWLVLNQIDRALFGAWLKTRKNPLYLVGSSIGAWRFAATAQNNPLSAIEKFQTAYFNQAYSAKPDHNEVTRVSYDVMDQYLDENAIKELLNHPYYRLSILTARCKHLLASDKRALLLAGVAIAASSNLLHPSFLQASFSREVFADPREHAPFIKSGRYKAKVSDLDLMNFKRVLMASGSIPGVMSRVSVHENNKSAYRDGGIMDYHLDLPYSENKYVLFPHYTDHIIPNWFDKYLKWRKPSKKNLRNVILVCPSKEFIKTLPLGKIPDRHDFSLFKGRDSERIQYWGKVVKECERLKEEFLDVFGNNRVSEEVKPLNIF